MKTRSFGKAASLAARGGIFSALSVLTLLLAQIIDVLDLTLAAFSALLIWLLILEYGQRFAFTVFAVTSVLGFILTPANTGVIVYVLAVGWYPLLKAFSDRIFKRKWQSLLIKCTVFSIAFGLMIFLFFKLFVGEMDFNTLIEDFALLQGYEHPAITLLAEKLNTQVLGLNLIQWMMVGMYMLFAPLFVLLYDLLITKFTRFYAIKLRPVLLKRGILKSDYR